MYYVEIQTLTIEDALVMLMLSPGRLSVSAGKFLSQRDFNVTLKGNTYLLFRSHP